LENGLGYILGDFFPHTHLVTLLKDHLGKAATLHGTIDFVDF
jgi:hypothetical protein